MPSHPPHTPSRAPRWAAACAAVLGAALAACSAPADTPGPAIAATGAAVAAVRVTGAGSTFDQPFFSMAFPGYQQAHHGVTVTYSAVGSSAGITAFTAGQVDFGATDVPASPTDLAAARSGPALQVPVDLGAVGIGKALIALLSWLTHDGQSYAATLGYVTLPPTQQLAATTLAQVTGPGGQPLTG